MAVIVFRDAEMLARGAARRIAELIRELSGAMVSVALAGGSTPAATYRELRAHDVPWERVYAWVGDERFVPPGDPDHNSTMVAELLLDGVEATFAPVPWRDGWDAADAALAYEQTLLGMLDHGDGGPRPDLMLLGIGDDGHTLSLFPDTDALSIKSRWFVENWVGAKDTWRLTATLPLAHRTRHLRFLVSGEGKASALRRILEPQSGEPVLPARLVADAPGDVVWFVDEAAASELRTTETLPGIP